MPCAAVLICPTKLRANVIMSLVQITCQLCNPSCDEEYMALLRNSWVQSARLSVGYLKHLNETVNIIEKYKEYFFLLILLILHSTKNNILARQLTAGNFHQITVQLQTPFRDVCVTGGTAQFGYQQNLFITTATQILQFGISHEQWLIGILNNDVISLNTKKFCEIKRKLKNSLPNSQFCSNQ